METKVLRASGYGLLSQYRGELMGLAMLWVMLFHAYELRFGVFLLDSFKALGFAGVDIFLLLSGMGLYVSLSQTHRGGGCCPPTTHTGQSASFPPTGWWWEPITCGCISAAASP